MPRYHKGKGALFIKEDREEGQPHFNGYINVTQDQLDALQTMLDNDVEARIQLGAWKTKSKKSGLRYIFIGTETYLKDEDDMPRKKRKAATSDDDDWDDDVPF